MAHRGRPGLMGRMARRASTARMVSLASKELQVILELLGHQVNKGHLAQALTSLTVTKSSKGNLGLQGKLDHEGLQVRIARMLRLDLLATRVRPVLPERRGGAARPGARALLGHLGLPA